jgi:hypothetical protein
MKKSREHSQAVQRVKVGLIGLAVVVLLIGFASAVMRTATREAPIAAVGAPKADVVATMTNAAVEQEVGEPLAELGVSPTTGNAQASAPAVVR